MSSLIGIKPAEGEPWDVFCQRRHTTTGVKASKYGRWSQKWAAGIVSWAAHVERKHDNKVWSHVLLSWHGDDWLQMQRLVASSGAESRTRTRSVHGKVHRRWEEGLCEARSRV